MIRIFLTIFAFAAAISAQTATFKWQSAMCEFSGTYDTKKYTAAQLRDTAKLFSHGELELGFYTVWKHEDIAKIDIAAVEKEYAEKSRRLRSLDIVNVPYWLAARDAQLRELEQRYLLTIATLRGYTDPTALRSYPHAEECKVKYAEPLIAGGSRLLDTWRQVNEESRKRNADPERLRREFEAEYASPDRMKHALMEVMLFGWNNCAIYDMDIVEAKSDGTYEREFQKLFRRVKTLYCEEP